MSQSSETNAIDKRDSIIYLTGKAVQGLLMSNSDIARHPNDLADKAIEIGTAVAEKLHAVVEKETAAPGEGKAEE